MLALPATAAERQWRVIGECGSAGWFGPLAQTGGSVSAQRSAAVHGGTPSIFEGCAGGAVTP